MTLASPAIKRFQDVATWDFIWLLVLGLVIRFGVDAFNGLFIILCVYAFSHRYYSIPLVFFSGYLKVIPIVSDFPIDFTILTLAFFCLHSVLNLFGSRISISKNKAYMCVLVGVMICIASISIFTTPASLLYLKGSGFFLLLNLFLVVSILLFWDTKQPDRILIPFSNFSIAIGILWIGQGLHNDIFNVTVLDWKYLTPMWHISSFGEDYMTFSTFVIFLIIRFGIRFMSETRTIMGAILMLVFFYCLVASPARGLTISLVFCIVFTSLYNFNGKVNVKYVALILIMAISVIGVIFYFRDELTIALSRLSTYGADTRSIRYRLDTLSFAFEKWSGHILFGTGIDSIMFFKGEPGGHVHNIIVETIVELGLFGGLPFLVFFAIALFCFHIIFIRSNKFSNYYLRWIGMIFLIFFVFSFFSGSLSQIRPLWIIMALMISISFNLKSTQESVSPYNA